MASSYTQTLAELKINSTKPFGVMLPTLLFNIVYSTQDMTYLSWPGRDFAVVGVHLDSVSLAQLA